MVGPGNIEWEGRADWQGAESAPGVRGSAYEVEILYVMTRFFEGDGGVWVTSYSGPESIATHAEGLAVGRAILAATLHGTANRIIAMQSGSNHVAGITQFGSGNYAKVSRTGNSDTASVKQREAA